VGEFGAVLNDEVVAIGFKEQNRGFESGPFVSLLKGVVLRDSE
jgi:hypothetical protein